MKYKTEQEEFWASQEWGDEYIERNNKVIKSNVAFFERILEKCEPIKELIEFGSNIGLNLHAINSLQKNAKISAIEINQNAVNNLEKLDFVDKIYHQSILDFIPDYKRDFVLISGVLIHINPNYLKEVYQKLYVTSSRYILVAEYYNPTPVELDYRGHKGKLFKRDFAGEMLDIYSDLKLVDYGFVYHRDNYLPLGDSFWFLLEKGD